MNEWKTVKEVYVILNKETKEFYKCRSGKVGWASINAAKNAFRVCTRAYFDSQDVYEVVTIRGGDCGKT